MRSQPQLRGVPFAVVAHVFIASANYPARVRGVRSGVLARDALRQCPDLVLVDVPRAEVDEAGEALFDLFGQCARAVEPGSLEEAFLDVGATSWEEAEAVGHHLRHRAARELHLPVSIGVGQTKLMAKLASRAAKPDGLHVIGAEQAAELRRTLPVGDVWGVGRKTLAGLTTLGVEQLAELDGVDDDQLRRACGTAMARRLRRIRAGTDDAVVRPLERRTTMSAESAVSGYGRADHTPAQLLELCVGRVCRRAERAGLVAAALSITVRLISGVALPTLKQTLPTATADPHRCLQAARALLENTPTGSVGGLRVALDGLAPAGAAAAVQGDGGLPAPDEFLRGLRRG